MTAIGRNDPCPCGSGSKYKHCCMRHRAFPAHDMRSRSRWPTIAMEIATKHCRAGRLQQAEGVLRVVLEEFPDYPAALYMLGTVLLEAQETDSAIAFLQRAVRVDSANPACHSNLGLAYMAVGLLNDAIGCWQSALQIDGDFAEAHNNLGNALLGQGETEKAAIHLRKAIASKPDYFLAHINLGNALRTQGKPYEAISCYRKAITIRPAYAHGHHNLGAAYCDFGMLEEAAASYRRALQLDPGLAGTCNDLGVVLLEMGRTDEAVASVRAALRLRPDFPDAYFNLHSLLLDPHDLGPSIRCLERLVALKPEDTLARFHLGVLLDNAGDANAATTQFRRVATGTALDRANLDAYAYMKSTNATLPPLVGTPIQSFRTGFKAATAKGLVLEFGVRFGASIRQIAALANGQAVHGFDSFEGLPEPWHDEPRGSYSTRGVLPAVPPNVFLHAGWFEHTLPAFLAAHQAPARFVNIDCDIYSATSTVLEALAGRIVPGTVLVFDEYFGHEHWRDDEFRAFQEAVARYRWNYEYVCISFSSGQAVVRIK